MLFISERGYALIKQFEGFSNTSYLCPAGKLTIGYGHVIKPEENFPQDGIAIEVAELLLKHDMDSREKALNRLVAVKISQQQCDALGAFIYNIGIRAFEGSTLLKLLNAEHMAAAADELLKWVFVNGRKNTGLGRRRAAERTLFLSS